MSKPSARLILEVRGYSQLLYAGEAEIRAAAPAHASSPPHDWEVLLRVPNVEVAQFQMRRGERVRIALQDGRSWPTWIDRFHFERGASASGFDGYGLIQLIGIGAAPEPAEA